MKQIICTLLVLFLCMCMPMENSTAYRDVHHRKPLYSMDDYESSYRHSLEKPGEKTALKLSETFEKIIQNKKGARTSIPPGIYADFAILMLEQGNYGAARNMAESEITLYPEAETYLNQLLKLQER